MIKTKYQYPIRIRLINNGYVIKYWGISGENEIFLKNKDELTKWINEFFPEN